MIHPHNENCTCHECLPGQRVRSPYTQLPITTPAHTQDHLEAFPELNGHCGFSVEDTTGRRIATFYALEPVKAGYGNAADALSRSIEGQSEAWANAQLFACSAQLVALAQHILDMHDDAYLVGHPEWEAIVSEAQAAIDPQFV